jgi:hypothetical protein
MEGFTQFIIILGAILEVIVLICFFKLCSDVSKIKESKNSNFNNNFGTKFLFLMSMGQKEEAKKLFINHTFSEIEDFMQNKPINDSTRKKALEFIKNKYDTYLEALDMKIDLSIFDKPKQ